MKAPVFDAHMHLGRAREDEGGRRYPRVTDEHLITLMDRLGIDLGVVTPLTSGWRQNQYVQEAVMRHKDRLVGFYWANPRSGFEDMMGDLVRGGFRGIKLRPESEGYRINNLNLLSPVLEAAERLMMPVYIHSSWDSPLSAPGAVERVAEAFPEVAIILGHMGGGSWEALKAAVRRENLFLETSGVRPPKIILEAVRLLGPERVVFGSDFPYLRPEDERAKIEELRIPEEDRELIMGVNMARILNLKPRGRRLSP
jgi:predicted TIM-barrel fold metal-dependent hydrolase